jgi:two-component system, LytTR family, sensor histidine kinase AlgZ
VHPILSRRDLTIAYAALWLVLGAALTVVERLPPAGAGAVVPLVLVYGFICLTPWYLCQRFPLRSGPLWRPPLVHLLVAFVSASLWVLLSHVVLALISGGPPAGARTLVEFESWMFARAVPVFLLSSVLHYLAIAVDASRIAETRAATAQSLAAQAELRALRAQLTPHFLFNSLNSISALTSADPPAARRMCVLLGDFLRGTLHLSTLDRIPLGQELGLVDQFLAIEQVRFGERLRLERAIAPEALAIAVPPLIVQPLAENALRHGVAQRLEGGTVSIEARIEGDELIVAIENPIDGPPRPRTGRPAVGLDNVRRRLDTGYGRTGQLRVGATADRYRAEIRLPAIAAPAPAAASKDDA